MSKMTTSKSAVCIFLLQLMIILLGASPSYAGRFVSSGPFVTVTLKDPQEKYQMPSPVLDDEDDSTQPKKNPWFDFGNLQPNAVWSLQSRGKPLPNWVPSWHSLRTTVAYRYESLRRIPSSIEADLKFSSERVGVDLQLQPFHDLASKQTALNLVASKGGALLMARLATKTDRWLQMIKGCYMANLPFATVGAVRVTPALDLVRGRASCLLEATTGTQRTKAVLNLVHDNPTLSVIHSLNERNTIAPEISLYDATILYKWNLALEGGSIQTRVNPTSDVSVTWTDRSMNGKWVTDVKIPLAGTTLSALAADIKVRRQFTF